MNGKLNIALIGAGGIGRLWAGVVRKSSKFSLAAVADTDIKKAEAVAGKFKNCLALSNWKAALKDKKNNAVLVATPHKFLAPISYAALSAGKHVLCEKPAGIHSTEIAKNIKAADKNHLAYIVGFNHRFHPAHNLAKKMFDYGEIGKLMFIRARYGFGGKPGYEKEWRFKKSISGGGELLDQGAHMIDMAHWFMGDIKKVKGFVSKLFWKNGEVEDNGFVLLENSKKGVASLHVSWSNWNWIHSFEVFGEKGYLIVEGLDQRYRGPERLLIGKRHPKFLKPPEEKVIKFESEQKEDSLARELREFWSAIRNRREPAPSGHDALAVLKIVEEIYAQK